MVSRGLFTLTGHNLDVTLYVMIKDLDSMCEVWVVFPPGSWENDVGPKGWYAVANEGGIVAYFGKADDAFRFRLAEINRALNG